MEAGLESTDERADDTPEGIRAGVAIHGAGNCPVADVRAEDGVLLLTLHLPGLERFREIVSALEGIADRVGVRYLVHGMADDDAVPNRTLVDCDRLTDRQCKVLRTAYRMVPIGMMYTGV